jgi:type II secretory pathway component PulJ
MWRYSLIALSCLLLGCQWLPSKPVSGALPLLSPAALGHPVVALQQVAGERDGQAYLLLFQLEVSADQLVLVASTATGNTLFSSLYRNGVIESERSPLLPNQLDPRYVLADLQLTFWPATALQPALAASGYRLQEDKLRRELWQGDELVVAINYSHPSRWQGEVHFEHQRWGYRYRINTLDHTFDNTVDTTADTTVNDTGGD